MVIKWEFSTFSTEFSTFGEQKDDKNAKEGQ